MSQTFLIAIVGTAIGVVAAFLFGLTARDPLTVAVVAAALLVVSLGAGLLPARRAATLDPVRAIKAE